MSALTNEQFKSIRCAQCGQPFRTYDKPGQSGQPHEAPYVDGGLISFHDDDVGAEVYYHGYVGQRGTCWAKAHPELDG